MTAATARFNSSEHIHAESSWATTTREKVSGQNQDGRDTLEPVMSVPHSRQHAPRGGRAGPEMPCKQRRQPAPPSAPIGLRARHHAVRKFTGRTMPRKGAKRSRSRKINLYFWLTCPTHEHRCAKATGGRERGRRIGRGTGRAGGGGGKGRGRRVGHGAGRAEGGGGTRQWKEGGARTRREGEERGRGRREARTRKAGGPGPTVGAEGGTVATRSSESLARTGSHW